MPKQIETMRKIEDASTKYNDLKGTGALDFHGSMTELHGYAESFGIDLSKYEPMGLDIYFGEVNFFYLSFLCIDKESSTDYQDQHNGQIPVISISVQETQEDFFSKLKKFNIKLGLDRHGFGQYDLINETNVDSQVEE